MLLYEVCVLSILVSAVKHGQHMRVQRTQNAEQFPFTLPTPYSEHHCGETKWPATLRPFREQNYRAGSTPRAETPTLVGTIYTRMEDGRISKDMLYGELADWRRPVGHLKLRFKDTRNWKTRRPLELIQVRTGNPWRVTERSGVPFSIAASRNATMSGFQLEQKRDRRKQINPEPPSDHAYKCNECDRICKSRIAGPLSNKTEFHLCETRWSFHRLLKTNICQQRNEQYRIKNLRRNKKLKAGNVCGRRRVSVRSFYLW